MSIVHVMDHPLIQHKLSLMRDQEHRPQGVPRAAERDLHADGLRGHA